MQASHSVVRLQLTSLVLSLMVQDQKLPQSQLLSEYQISMQKRILSFSQSLYPLLEGQSDCTAPGSLQ